MATFDAMPVSKGIFFYLSCILDPWGAVLIPGLGHFGSSLLAFHRNLKPEEILDGNIQL
jgi:hypothetical protein